MPFNGTSTHRCKHAGARDRWSVNQVLSFITISYYKIPYDNINIGISYICHPFISVLCDIFSYL